MKHRKILVVFCVIICILSQNICCFATEDKSLNDTNDVAYTSDVPQVYITEDGELTKDTYTDANIVVKDVKGGTFNTIDTTGKIKLRGNSTLQAAKKPYTIKFTSKQNLFGMGKDKKWVLLANAYDKSLIRSKLFYDFTNKTCVKYTPDSQYVDLWLNNVYKGSYLLVEPIEADKNRVDIDPHNGDYLLEIEKERNESDVKYLKTNLGIRFAINEPEDPNDEQVQYLQNFISKVEDAISSNEYDEYSKYIDVDYYIVLELSKGVDTSYSSTRFYIKDGKLYGGPVWDFDLSAGNASQNLYSWYYTSPTEGYGYIGLVVNDIKWYQKLLANEKFLSLVKQKYLELQPEIENLYMDNGLGTNKIDQLSEKYKISFNNNYTIAGWPIDSVCGPFERYPYPTYKENLDYLRMFLKKRNNWLLDYYGLQTLESVKYKASNVLQEKNKLISEYINIGGAENDDGLVDITNKIASYNTNEDIKNEENMDNLLLWIDNANEAMTSINVLIDQLNEKITKNKESAIIELEYYRSNQIYTEEINTDILEIKEEGNKKIQEITNLNDINKIIQEYKEKIDNVLEFVVKVDGVDQIVEYGEDVVLPEPEVKEGYTFVGWEGQTKEIKANGNVIAKYEINKYTVTVNGVDQTVEYGKDVVLPEPEVKEGYTFVGWEGQTREIKADGTVNAKYEINKYTVTVNGVDQTVEYGKDVVLPEPPVKEGYTFAGWEGQTKEIKANGNVIAKYEKNEDLSSSSNTKDKSKAFGISIALIFSIGAMLKSRGKNE